MKIKKLLLAGLSAFMLTTATVSAESQASIDTETINIEMMNTHASATSGTCGSSNNNNGNNAKWELSSSGVLTISGSGDMADYGHRFYLSPWNGMQEQIKSVVVKSGITSLGNGFVNCGYITKISLPSTIKKIAPYALNGCSGLKSINIPNSVQTIGENAFYGCASLTGITVSKNVTSIGAGAFMGCSSLKSFVVPSSIKTIEDMSFFCDTSLSSIVIPSSVTRVNEKAFEYCNSLKNIYYTGTQSQWKKIVIASGNDYFKKAKITYNYRNSSLTQIHEHSWGSWSVTKKATVLSTGTKTRKCKGCSEKDTVTIAKLKATGKLNKTSVVLTEKKTSTPFKVSGLAYGDKVRSYTSGNKSVFTVTSSGKITAKKAGDAQLTVKLASGKKLTATVSVRKASENQTICSSGGYIYYGVVEGSKLNVYQYKISNGTKKTLSTVSNGVEFAGYYNGEVFYVKYDSSAKNSVSTYGYKVSSKKTRCVMRGVWGEVYKQYICGYPYMRTKTQAKLVVHDLKKNKTLVHKNNSIGYERIGDYIYYAVVTGNSGSNKRVRILKYKLGSNSQTLQSNKVFTCSYVIDFSSSNIKYQVYQSGRYVTKTESY